MSDATYRFPKLRWPLEIRVETIEDQSVLLIRCPLGVSPGPLFLVPAVAPVLSLFNGSVSSDEILKRFAAQGLNEQVLREIIDLLDNHLFLANSRYHEAEVRLREDFARSTVRRASRAGFVYSADPNTLRSELDSYLRHGAGLGPSTSGDVVGIVAPHIDYRRGHACYGMTYALLPPAEHDVIVLIGTSHQYSKRLFHLTAKHFESPLGTVSTDTEFVTLLAKRYGAKRSFEDELLHRDEHSLELQIPFLARTGVRAKIVPILVGSFHSMVETQSLPNQSEEYESFVESLVEVWKTYTSSGRKVCFLAGVDMAHVGATFGDEEPLTPATMERVARRDHQYLETIVNHAPEQMFAHISEDLDARRVCGFPTMYTVMDVLRRLGTRYDAAIVDYRQATDFRAECAVTMAGILMRSRVL